MPFLFGVIEGFYGNPWTHEQRMDLMGVLKQRKLNIYVYAPKDEEKHRKKWKDHYNKEEVSKFKQLIKQAEDNEIAFVYALSPGAEISYSSEKDTDYVVQKYKQLQEIGCKSFALFFDDISSEFKAQDKLCFKSLSEAQAKITNNIHNRVKQCSHFIFCPTVYCDDFCKKPIVESEYLVTLGASLNSEIDVFWTGPSVISKQITDESLRPVCEVLKRPPIIWDNLFANDYALDHKMFLGPYSGRSPMKNMKGVLLNPNCQYGANFIPLLSFSLWTTDDKDYNLETALNTGINEWIVVFTRSYKDHKFKNIITTEDLRMFIELFYLPYSSQEFELTFIATVKRLIENGDRMKDSEGHRLMSRMKTMTNKIITAIALSTSDKQSHLQDMYSTAKKLQLCVNHIIRYMNSMNSKAMKIESPTKASDGVIKELQSLLPLKNEAEINLRSKEALKSVK